MWFVRALPPRRLYAFAFAAFLASAGLVLPAHVASAQIDQSLYSGLVWRNIGPFRGGRISAVTGVIGQPGVFYAGLPLGGVWKTTSAGITWFPIFDGVKEVSSVGAIEVAPSDPNIIYVGTGDLITGGGINEGDGVYKSTDAGKTWQHLGLDQTKQIPSVLVDPHDPSLVLIAAQGNIHAETDMRGVFRSTDGGATWKKTLFVDNHTGIQKLAWAYDHPNVILATTVQHYNAPGVPPARGGGPGAESSTKLFKSTDEGVTWTELTGNGLPTLTGRTSVAVAMNTNAQRMFLIGGFGLYRSDDGGTSWHQVARNDRRIAGSTYICDVYVDSKNPDLVYTMATSSYKSTDGGMTFTGFKGAPGGDDPHVLWIDPTNGNRMFLGVDQGATITLDGGHTWSPWYNQPMEQVYHISVDNQFPYWVYASQQDAGTIATRSRGDLGEITPFDWAANPGYEFGTAVADPLNPKIVYAGGPSGGIIKVMYPSGQWINISPNVETGAALRKVGNQPLLWSTPHELLAGFQYVMATTDGAMHWKRLSPDLTLRKNEVVQAGGAGRGRGGAAGAVGTGAIESLSASTVAPGTIWAGTNNGIIQVTRDHGVTWTDVSIPDLPNPTHADISSVDASHHEPGTAYVAVDYHTVGDYLPYVYRTHDYGKTWTKIVNGMRTDQPSGSFARVVRADTKRKGLLFAGTESSMYVSFDDGDHWQSLQLNLPNTSYRDIAIHDNDLVVGTYGRSIYVLDDYSPLREVAPAIASEPAHLFKPGDAIRVRRNVNGDTPFPPEVPHAENPPTGAILYYYLGAQPTGDMTLDIFDASGRPVRHYSSAAPTPYNDSPPNIPDFWVKPRLPLPTATGTNRVNWNIRYDDPPSFTHNYAQVMGANPERTPASPEGPLALPGTYTVKLTVNGKTYTQTVKVTNDPRSAATAADLRIQHDLQMKVYDASKEAWAGYEQVAAMRASVAELLRSGPSADVADAARAFDAKLASVGGAAPAGGRGGGRGNAGPPRPPNFAALNGTMNNQLRTLDFGDMAPNEPMLRSWTAACSELASAVSTWHALNGAELSRLNAALGKTGQRPIAAGSPTLSAPSCGP